MLAEQEIDVAEDLDIEEEDAFAIAEVRPALCSLSLFLSAQDPVLCSNDDLIMIFRRATGTRR